MANADLVKYIREGLARGTNKNELRGILAEAGWVEDDIVAGFSEIESPAEKPPVTAATPSTQPKISTPEASTTQPVKREAPQSATLGMESLRITPQTQAPQAKSVQEPASAPVKQVYDSRIQFTDGEVIQTSPAPVLSAEGNTNKRRFSMSKRAWIIVVVSIAALLLVAGGVFAYVMNIGPFSHAPYTEDNIASGILKSLATIDTATYKVSGEMFVEDREEGAVTFLSVMAEDAEFKEKYARDVERVEQVGDILLSLNMSKSAYPASIVTLTAFSGPRSRAALLNTKDPRTQQSYRYSISDAGRKFTLRVEFETRQAVSAIRSSYDYDANKTSIDGLSVTFTQDSSAFVYLSAKPPLPWLAAVADSVTYLTPDTKGLFSVSAQSDFRKTDADWKFNISAVGDLGDFAYKFDLDALRKDGTYYLRINNIPGIFLAFMGGLQKGMWLKVDPMDATQDGGAGSIIGDIASGIPEAEEGYQENRDNALKILKEAVRLADSEGLFMLKGKPKSERVDGQALYRYDITLRKEAIAPFADKLLKEVDKLDLKNDGFSVLGQTNLEYLSSEAFLKVFDYYNDNTELSIWLDAKGVPARITYRARIIPTEEAVTLQDKQVIMLLTLEISDVNEDIDIATPEDARSLDEFFSS